MYDELVLSDNKIRQLNDTSFQRIKVKKLYLNGNPIETIHNKTFQYLANYLDELWLDSDSTMATVPFAVTNYLKNLNCLRLKNFNLIRLGNYSFVKLQRLEILSIESSAIEHVDTNAFHGLKNTLRELYLNGNALTAIPIDALRDLNALKVLGLSQNSIKILDQFSFTPFYHHDIMPQRIPLNINKLDLSYNGIASIEPDTFGSNMFHNLNVLSLQNNELNDLNLNNLLNNPHMQKLKELYLDFNVITSLRKNSFDFKRSLEILSLQGKPKKFHFIFYFCRFFLKILFCLAQVIALRSMMTTTGKSISLA